MGLFSNRKPIKFYLILYCLCSYTKILYLTLYSIYTIHGGDQLELLRPVGSGIIRKYQKNIKRKLKDGTQKTYNTEQTTVNIEKDNKFIDGESVKILDPRDFLGLDIAYNNNEKLQKEFNNVSELYSKCTKTRDELSDEIKRLRNKHDHTQENLRKSLEQINTLQNEINQYANRGFLDYLLGRKIKQPELSEAKKE